MSETALSSLRRQVSAESESIVSQLSKSLPEEKLLLALQAIKLAVASGRLTLEDSKTLKRQMLQREPFDDTIVKKLGRAERFCLLDYDQREDDLDSPDRESTEEARRDLECNIEEVEELRKKLPPISIPLCYVCDERSDEKLGLFCENGNDDNTCQPDRHFQCSDCLTSWVEVLNGQRSDNSDLLQARNGLVRCCVLGKIS